MIPNARQDDIWRGMPHVGKLARHRPKRLQTSSLRVSASEAQEGVPQAQTGIAVVHSKEPGDDEANATVVNISAPVVSSAATDATAQAAGAPCKLPFPALVFSPLPHVRTAHERSAAALGCARP